MAPQSLFLDQIEGVVQTAILSAFALLNFSLCVCVCVCVCVCMCGENLGQELKVRVAGGELIEISS